MADYLRKECGDLNEMTSDNDDIKDGRLAWQVSKPEIPIKGRKEFSCRHEIQIREDKNPEQKTKPCQWLCCIRIKFVW